jgi:hypothetical protein
MNANLIIAVSLLVVAQTLSYFQLQGQFIWEWVRKYPYSMTALGIPISILLINSTKHCALAFEGQTWPGRLIGFAVGAIIFAILSWVLLKEPMQTKTAVCLLLAVSILLIQIFWK